MEEGPFWSLEVRRARARRAGGPNAFLLGVLLFLWGGRLHFWPHRPDEASLGATIMVIAGLLALAGIVTIVRFRRAQDGRWG